MATIPLSALKSDDYHSLELENQAAPKTPGRSLLTLALGAVSIIAVGFGAGFVFEKNYATNADLATNDVQAAHEVQAMIAQAVKIPSQAQKLALENICDAWYHCEIGPAIMDPVTGLPEAGPGCVAERATHMLRWGFHDCATRSDSSGNGGCHACNIIPNSAQRNCPANNGLQVEPDELMDIYNTYLRDPVTGEAPVGVADWLHLCTAVGVKLASEAAEDLGLGVKIDILEGFKFGRTDCVDQGLQVDAQCGYASRIPASSQTWEQFTSTMRDEGFTDWESVTINGAHNMGGSGAHSPHGLGSWTANDAVFGNQYFKSISKRNWKSRPTTNPALTGDSVQYFGNFNDGVPNLNDVEPVYGDCPPFAPVGADGLPLQPFLPEPGCFIDDTAPEGHVCSPCVELMSIKTDLEVKWQTTNPAGCSLHEAEIALGAVACSNGNRPLGSLVDFYARDPASFAMEYKLAHQKMSLFGNRHAEEAGLEPKEYIVEVAVPVPGPAVPVSGG